MTKKSFKLLQSLSLCLFVIMTSCKETVDKEKKEDMTMNRNSLLQDWTGPYDGVPAFDKMKVGDVKEAVEQAMVLGLKDYEKIANSDEPPTFENTIAEMERAGKKLERVFTYYGILSSNLSSPEFRIIQAE